MSTKITMEAGEHLKEFIASNEKGQSIKMSGDGSAPGPMQTVLMAIAGCSTIDVVMILEKMRQGLKDIKVEVEGERQEEIPRIYTKIHIHYKIYGEVKENKAEQAIAMSVGKYCSVSKMIEKSAEITTSFEIISS